VQSTTEHYRALQSIVEHCEMLFIALQTLQSIAEHSIAPQSIAEQSRAARGRADQRKAEQGL
jgi:hypothetical protein